MKKLKHTLVATAIISLLGVNAVHAKTPVDLGVVNEDKLAEMLVRRGLLDDSASLQERSDAVKSYLDNKIKHGFSGDAQFGKQAKHHQSRIINVIEKQQGLKKSSVFALEVTNKRTDKVLALLVDFPDLPWDDNKLTEAHTSMLYPSYPPEHYQTLLFSDTGYTGPKGNNLISMRQYYEQESGDSYSVSGQATGWYRAEKNAAYYGGNSETTDNDKNAQALVREALAQLAKDPSVNLADYDIEDRYDFDGDGNFREPDGVIDHLMVFHASVGEEAGGGVLGPDAIWSHRFNLGQPYVLEGTTSSVPEQFNGNYAAFDYTMQPIDAAAGVCAHEYGHDLGLPDEYDTQYTGAGEPVSYWSIMSSGSWAGKIGGTQPTAFSSWAKTFLQNAIGGRWINDERLSIEELKEKDLFFTLFQTTDNDRPNMVRIDLPMKKSEGLKPFEGTAQFHSEQGDSLNNSMSRSLDIPAADAVKLVFKAWYQIEKDYDFARVLINGKPISGNITTLDDPLNTGLAPAIGGESDGWIDAEFDLSDYAGQTVTLGFDYITDGGLAMKGLFLDNIALISDGDRTLIDDAESTSTFTLDGFKSNTGFYESNHYYLLQWRSHNDVDEGLNNIKRMGQLVTFEPGLIIWYVDDSFKDNAVGKHPGQGWLGILDADQNALLWADTGLPAQTRFQVRDAAFSLHDQTEFSLTARDGNVLEDSNLAANGHFADSQDYSLPEAPDSGRIVTEYGLVIDVLNQADNNEYGVLKVSYSETPNVAPQAIFDLVVDGLEVTTTNRSTDSDGKIDSYLWDFGNGQISNEISPVWKYTESGSYTVTLMVTDNDGETATVSETINVVAPNVEPEVGAKYIHLGRLVTLWSTSTDSDGRIVDTEWQLPNGKTKRGRLITAMFPSYGHHVVTLKVIDNDGAVVSKVINVKI